MPRYEIVAHVTRELDCETAEEAAAVVRRQLLAEANLADGLAHLAVWRQASTPAASHADPGPRQHLDAFFAALERCAEEAEADFRGRVAALFAGQENARRHEESALENERT